MKKILTLFVALFATMSFVNAQAILMESFDTGTLPTGWSIVDADGDGQNWNPQLETAGFDTHSGTGLITSASYINNVGPLTPDNWLITPQINLSAAADLTFWAWGQDESYYAEKLGVYVSTTGTNVTDFTSVLQVTTTHAMTEYTVNLSAYVGQNIYIAFRHYDVTDMFYLNLDDVEIFAQPTTPTIVANPTALTFATTPIGDVTASKTITVTGYVLTDAIVATATAPFEVSADNTTFGATATIAAAGAPLYVRYAPATAGTENGTITLSSTGAPNVTITATGVGVDCSGAISTFPFVEDFNSGIVPPGCWTVVYGDNNPDVNTVQAAATNEEMTEFAFAFNSYDETTDYSQYLITPEIEFTGAMALQFHVASYNTFFGPSSETFMIGTSSTTNDVNAFTWSEEMTCSSPSFANIYREIPAGTKYVAIKYTSEYAYYLFVDNFSLEAATGIEEITADNVNVYPNPTKDIVNVNAPAQINNIEVYNIAGQKLSVYNVNNMTAQIDVTELANGIYFLKINTENGMVTKKFNVVK